MKTKEQLTKENEWLKAEVERLTTERSVRIDILEQDLDKCKTFYANAIDFQRKQAEEIERLKAN